MRQLAALTAILIALSACGEEEEPPKPPTAAGDTSGIDSLNGFRALMNIPPVTSNKQLSTAAQAHVDYYLANNGVEGKEDCAGPKISPHNEVPGCDGFTGEAPWDRTGAAGYGGIVGECIAFYDDGPQAMYGWLATVYHRLCIAAPEVFEIGYAKGTNTTTGSKVDVVEVGHASTTDVNHIGRWPVPDAQDVPKSWDGLESPQPPVPPNGYPSGPIISVSYSPNDDVVINGASFSDHIGTIDDIYVLTPSNDPNLEGSSSYFLYTHEPLVERRTYTVRFTGTRDGGFWTDQWSFFVPCDRSMPDEGKACDGNNLLSCNINEPVQADCGSETCVEWQRGARCLDGPITTCGEPDNTFLRCDGSEIIYCLGGYQMAQDCGVDICHVGPNGGVCASEPVTPCTTTDTYCEGNFVILCDEDTGFMRHRDCGAEELHCQVNSDGTRGYCAAMAAPCASENGGRCAGLVPIDCVDNWEVPGVICETTCVEDGQEANCE